jgi:hypothetical protein
MVRAAITPEEWTAIRKRALDLGISTTELVARYLRKGLNDGS